MEISRRTDYAIRLIAALVEAGDKPLSVREAAARYGVPYAFARSIQHDLAGAGFVQTVRGAQGGMLLAVNPNQLTLFELIETVQGPISVAICTTDSGWCERNRSCTFHKVWEGANSILRDYLSSVSIQQLLEGETAFLNDPELKLARA